MKAFGIFENQVGQFKAVKSGWSWPAFFTHMFGVSWIWAFAKGHMPLGTLLLLWHFFFLVAIVGTMAGEPAYAASYVLWLLIDTIAWFVLGAKGNSMITTKLSQKGYIYKDMVMAGDPSMAEMIAMKEKKEADKLREERNG